MISRQICGPLLATAFALLSDPARADALTSAVGTRQSLSVTAIAAPRSGAAAPEWIRKGVLLQPLHAHQGQKSRSEVAFQ